MTSFTTQLDYNQLSGKAYRKRHRTAQQIGGQELAVVQAVATLEGFIAGKDGETPLRAK